MSKTVRKLSVWVSVAALLLACSSTKNYVAPGDGTFTMEKYDACINPVEEHFIKQFRTKVLRHKDCMGIDDLLAVVWAGERTKESLTGASLMAIAYVARLARIDSSDTKFFVSYLDTGTFSYMSGVAHAAFFEIKSKRVQR